MNEFEVFDFQQMSADMERNMKDDVDEFPSGEDPNRDGKLVGSDNLRKGPWTPEEDAILEDYVSKHGYGNWNAVQKVSGLLRCGKSCRLRWANHLRPDLKKGPFSSEEERLVIKLHAKLGNKWARMAAKLPGRTDNEIKNFWNTRAKRLRRDGVSVYPPDVRAEIQSESQESPESGTLSGNLRNSHSVMEPAELDIPEFQIQGDLNTGLYTSHSSIFSLQARNRRPQEPGPGSLAFGYMSQPIGLGGQGQGSDMTLREAAYGPFIGQVNGMALEQHQAYVIPPLPEIYSNTEDQPLSFDPGSHALVNGGNYHVTCPTDFGHQKFELPSFQRSPDQFESSQINMPQIDQPEEKTTYDLEVLSEADWKEVLAVSDPNACTQVGSLPGNSADDDPLPGPVPAGRTSSSSSNQTSIQQDPSEPDEWFNEYLLNLAKRQGKD